VVFLVVTASMRWWRRLPRGLMLWLVVMVRRRGRGSRWD
jgi:hypothetical protein